MTMGHWHALATVILRKNKSLQLPEPLINILKRTDNLYREDITPDVSDVMNWRNQTIGHGALRFEDDESCKEEIHSLTLLLKNYFDGGARYSVNDLYKNVYFVFNGLKLTGDNLIEPENDSELKLFVNTIEYEAKKFVNTHNLKCYLFDSYYSKKKQIKFTSYIDGQSELKNNGYFSDLFNKYVVKYSEDFSLQADVTSRQEDIILEYLNTPSEYIKPLQLIDSLVDIMDDISHGTIAVFMERGTGKSAFSNQMSGLYHKTSLIKNSFSRCYHVQNATLRGVNDFINSLNFSFRHSFDPGQDLWGSTDEMPVLAYDSQTPAEDLAAFLNYYHEKYRKENTILLIDGIDEMVAQSRKILEYIPSSDLLDDGVFIVLLSRFKDENTVVGTSKKYIEFTEKNSDAQIRIHRTDAENICILTQYINQQIKSERFPKNVNIEELIKKADYRFLFLKAYIGVKAEILLDNHDERRFVSNYLNYVLSFYGTKQKRKIKEIAVTIALFPSISIRKYKEYIDCTDITYEFIGMLNDLLPILTVLHINGEDIYTFADGAYSEFVLSEFSDVTDELIMAFYQSLVNNLQSYLKNDYLARHDEIKVDEDLLNESIAFYVEGIISIWNAGLNNKYIREAFFSCDNGTYLCGRLQFDSWGRIGYGKYLKDALGNCYGDVVNYCLQHPEDRYATHWYKWTCARLQGTRYTRRHRENVIYGLELALASSKGFKQISSYVLENHNQLKLENWFWVLKIVKIDKSIEVLRLHTDLIDSYLDYLYLHERPVRRKKWINKLFETSLPANVEARVLNLQLRKLISSPQFSSNSKVTLTEVKKCLEEIRSKGYELDNTLIKDINETLKHLRGNNLTAERFKQKTEKAIYELLNFNNEWKNNRDKSCSLYKALRFIASEFANSPAFADPNDIKELYSAFYKRMCFERNKRDWSFFIDVEYFLDHRIVDILKNEFGEEETYYQALCTWISYLRNEMSLSSKIINLLALLTIQAVEWSSVNGNEEQSLKLLEDYIYNYDTIAFFASYYSGRVTNVVDPASNYLDKPLLYCTNNALYLLDYYRQRGYDNKFKYLMKKIEDDVQTIDEVLSAGYESQVVCEIYKFKFMKYRSDIGYFNDFNKYLYSILQSHIFAIEHSLKFLSRFSDFQELAFHTEILAEYFWQTKQWDTGVLFCDDLIRTLNNIDSYNDIVVSESIRNQVGCLKQISSLFRYLSGEKTIEESAKNISGPNSYYVIGTQTIGDAVRLFYRLPAGDKAALKNWIYDKIELKVAGIPRF